MAESHSHVQEAKYNPLLPAPIALLMTPPDLISNGFKRVMGCMKLHEVYCRWTHAYTL